MINYETWQSQLNHFDEQEQVDFEKINESFRCLFADSQALMEIDTQ